MHMPFEIVSMIIPVYMYYSILKYDGYHRNVRPRPALEGGRSVYDT